MLRTGALEGAVTLSCRGSSGNVALGLDRHSLGRRICLVLQCYRPRSAAARSAGVWWSVPHYARVQALWCIQFCQYDNFAFVFDQTLVASMESHT